MGSEIYNMNDIKDIIRDEGLDIAVISHGGSCSNLLVNKLEENGYSCKTEVWHKLLCHYPEYTDFGIPVIYVYDNFMKSFFSMKRREIVYQANHRKLSNNLNIEYSDETLLKLMVKQFNSFYENRDKLLLIKSSELFENGIDDKLKKFLKTNKLNNFPLQFKAPHTILNYNNFNLKHKKLFMKHFKSFPNYQQIEIPLVIGSSETNTKVINLNYFPKVNYKISLKENEFPDTFNFKINKNKIHIKRTDLNKGWKFKHICYITLE